MRIVAEGTKTIVAADTAEQLTATGRACNKLWIGAPVGAGGATVNSGTVFVGRGGEDSEQLIPVVNDNFEGLEVTCENPADIYVKGAEGDKVNYAVYYSATGL